VRRATILLAALAAVLLAAGCGAEGVPEAGNTSNGEMLFKQECGQCHTLAAAGTQGQVGPNLDAAFMQDRVDGIGEETIAGIVRGQIAYPITETVTGAPGMPADLVTGQDADDVAAYVASVAAKPSAGGPQAAGGGGGQTTGGDETTGGGGETTGGGGEADGKQIFASAGCVSCHTLADAGSNGTIGPNLDEAKPSKELAVDRVTNGAGAMPAFKGQLTDAEIEAVAEYVASAAG
jgi:mono/diheme cytochrome c family protein